MFCFRGNAKCVACGVSRGVRCTDCTVALKADLRETLSALRGTCLGSVLQNRGSGRKKWSVLQGEMKAITDSGSSAGK